MHVTSLIGGLLALFMLVLAIAFSGNNGPSTAVVAVVGLAAAQTLSDVLKNLAAGSIIKGSQPFNTNDRIEVEDCAGVVTHIGWRLTTIARDDGRKSQIPNAGLLTSIITIGESHAAVSERGMEPGPSGPSRPSIRAIFSSFGRG